MIVFLYGEDVYRREAKVRELLKKNREKNKDADIQFFNLYENREDWKRVKEFLLQPSMFSHKKTVILRGSGEADIKEWRELLKKEIVTDDHILIISDEQKPSKNFSFLLESPVKTSEYEQLKGKKLEIFLVKEAERMGVRLYSDVWKVFVSHVESFPLPSAAGVCELEKCALFSTEAPISIEALNSLLHLSSAHTLAQIVRSLVREKRPEKRIALLEEALLDAVEPARLFNTLVYEARGEDIERLATFDVNIKSGTMDYEEALLFFALYKKPS